MGTRELPLPMCFELLLGKERDRWPLEARLICAAHNGSVRKLKKIAKELDVHGHGIPATVANTTYMGMNVLDAAGGCGSLPVYRYLVEELKMDAGKPDTAQGRSEIVKFLLSKGADVDALSDAGTPLTLASLRGHASILKILLQHNADPNKGNGVFVPLDVALNKSFVSCVKLLVQGGTNVNGDNPLAKAAEKGLTEAIKCLVEAGANPNVIDRFGRLPIELAAEYGTREDVEILFPFTSPISTVANWTVDGIIKHVEMEIKQLEDGSFVKKKMSDLKQQGDEAFKKQDYQNASVFYTQALKMDNFDTKLLSNRSLCLLRMGEGRRAYEDAADCTKLRPKWAKAHYRAGAALMFMKEYDAAYSSLSRALELDPESEEIEKLFWEAMELK
ncbi:protein TANC1-like isoform X2 [Triticum urartu]|uniref:Serine/threonine-protein kinase BSK1-like TPR repeats domain-containing protein n=1 Tax=Triticum urartu TaxID=4572 RepID=A0A8R7UDE6_TRIUA|nr:protein TANC1-like isoform X2 [Triticum urartu]